MLELNEKEIERFNNFNAQLTNQSYEKLEIVKLSDLRNLYLSGRLIYNLQWLIPYCLDDETGVIQVPYN